MKRFSFRLERVQRVRQIERDRAEAEWARARAQQSDVEQRMLSLREQAAADASGIMAGQVQSPEQMRAVAFRASLRARAAEIALVDLAAAEQVTQAQAESLLQASRKVDALDRLEIRHHEAWTVDYRREESAVMDDIANTRSARGNREESR